jgi:hypothetical protein
MYRRIRRRDHVAIGVVRVRKTRRGRLLVACCGRKARAGLVAVGIVAEALARKGTVRVCDRGQLIVVRIRTQAARHRARAIRPRRVLRST